MIPRISKNRCRRWASCALQDSLAEATGAVSRRAADCTRGGAYCTARAAHDAHGWPRGSWGRVFQGWGGYNRGFTARRMVSVSPSDPTVPATYEDALAELERLVAAMEGGQLPLDQLLQSYRRGAELLGFCRSRLEAAGQQVQGVVGGRVKPR